MKLSTKIVVAGAVLGFCALAGFAHAATFQFGSGNFGGAGADVIQKFTLTATSTFTSGTFGYQTWGGNRTIEMLIVGPSGSYASDSNFCTITGSTLLDATTTASAPGYGTSTETFTFPPVTLSPGSYGLVLYLDAFYHPGILAEYPTSTNGWRYLNNSGCSNSEGSGQVIWGYLSGPSLPSVSLDFPDSTHVTPDFSNWVLSITNPSSNVSSPQYVGVQYGLASGTYTYNDSAAWSPYVSVATNFPLPKKQPLWQIPYATTTVWYVQPYYFASSTFTYGSEVQIVVNNSVTAATSTAALAAGPFLPFDASSTTGIAGMMSSSSPFSVDCSAYDGASFFSSSTVASLGCQVQKVLWSFAGILFNPSDDAISSFKGKVTQLQTVFPFSLVGAVSAAVETAANGVSSTNPGLMSTGTVSGYSWSFDIIPASVDLATYIGAENKAKIFGLFSALLWISAGFIVLKFV